MHVWALGLLCETPAQAKVEIGQSSSRPSSLGLIEKNWNVFRFPWLFHVGVFFTLCFQALKIFSLEMSMRRRARKQPQQYQFGALEVFQGLFCDIASDMSGWEPHGGLILFSRNVAHLQKVTCLPQKPTQAPDPQKCCAHCNFSETRYWAIRPIFFE